MTAAISEPQTSKDLMILFGLNLGLFRLSRLELNLN